MGGFILSASILSNVGCHKQIKISSDTGFHIESNLVTLHCFFKSLVSSIHFLDIPTSQAVYFILKKKSLIQKEKH